MRICSGKSLGSARTFSLNSTCSSSTWSFADGGAIWSFNSPATGSTTLAKTCLIFVHGLQEDSGTYLNWNIARNYWKGTDNTTGVATDFIKTATRDFAGGIIVKFREESPAPILVER